MNPSPFHLLISFWKKASFASSVMLKISSAESFEWNVTKARTLFSFSVNQIGIRIYWPEIVLYRPFLAPCCCIVFLNQHMFFRLRKKSAFFSRYAVLSKNNQIRNSCDTFQRNQTPGFPMLIFPTKNKYYFHYYFHGTIFLRFKKI